MGYRYVCPDSDVSLAGTQMVVQRNVRCCINITRIIEKTLVFGCARR